MKLLSTSVLAIFLASLMLGGCSSKDQENAEATAKEAVEYTKEHAEHAAQQVEEAAEDAKEAAEDAISKARAAAAEQQ
ncbi:Protein of unknown function [Methylobacillus rhizosphaerae]|uniref:Lipoprotein n=1 Tax=Methylobacillus rhizosphaerae TaxID=551994 RepID=A0A238Z8W7_9PROT|nr:hypothetical protein [Methylobacillus rhizosphaerae]SNR79747.1 Protein of unknown function [Methylobacillus rhizosphaerae]